MTNVSKFNWPVRVYFEDTDAGGIVYHARYLYFLERARTEWLRELGFNQSLLKQQNVLFVVRDMNIKWQKPAVLDDALTVTVDVMVVKKASLKMQQTIKTENEQKLHADVTIACIDATNKKPMAIPQAILSLITVSDEIRS
ncbi:MAG: tol-pal system-associated acyl-CoA thioesterase [Bermanella sp.]